MQPPSPNDKQDSDRMIKAVLLSLVIIVGYHLFVEKPQADKMQQQQAAQTQEPKSAAGPVPVPAPAAEASTVKLRADVITATSRIPVHGAKVTGSISLTGARIDDLSLNDQYTT